MKNTHRTTTNLSELNVLPQLINGKVVIINENENNYEMVKPFDNITIADNFDPIDYSLSTITYIEYEYLYKLQFSKELGKHIKEICGTRTVNEYTCKRISLTSSFDKRKALAKREHNLINKLYNNKKNVEVYNLGKGDKIHIHSRRGVYQVVSINTETITITCNKWQYDVQKTRTIKWSDYQCLAGGLHNWAY